MFVTNVLLARGLLQAGSPLAVRRIIILFSIMKNVKQISPYFDTCLMLSAGFLYFLRVLFGTSLLYACTIVAILMLIRYLPVMSKSYKLPAYVFTLLSFFLLARSHAPFEEWARALTSMMNVVAMVSIMQTLSVSMNVGNYNKAVSAFLSKHAKNQGILYYIVELFSHFLCSILNLGEAVIVLNAIDDNVSNQIKDYKKYISGAISRGHCTAFLWAPGSVTVLLTLQIFKIEWTEYMLPAFLIGLIGLLLGGMGQYSEYKKIPFISAETSEAGSSARKIAILCLIILTITFGMSVLNKIFPNSTSSEIMVFDVTIVSFFWLLFQIKRPGITHEIKRFSTKTLPTMGSLNTFFITMGLFSESIRYAGFNHIIQSSAEVFRQLPCILLLFVLPLIIILFSLIGIHPMVSLAVLSPLLIQLVGNASPMQLALVTAMGCCLSYMISPFAGLILLLSQLLDLEPRQLALEYNLRYSLAYYIIGVLIVCFLF